MSVITELAFPHRCEDVIPRLSRVAAVRAIEFRIRVEFE